MKKKLNYRYETLEVGQLDVHIRSLRDVQEYEDDNNEALDMGISDSQWSISGVLWPASFVLASIMEKKKLHKLKILEVGCGLALASIVLKLRGADITVTDNNPAVESFLTENTRINECSNIPFRRADWKNIDIAKDKDSSSSDNQYDLIIGSDLLYEREHPKDLCNFININAKNECEVIIVDPKRGNTNKFTKIMQDNHFVHHVDMAEHLERYSIKFKGTVNYYKRTA